MYEFIGVRGGGGGGGGGSWSKSQKGFSTPDNIFKTGTNMIHRLKNTLQTPISKTDTKLI